MGSRIKSFSRNADGSYEWTQVHDNGRRPKRRRTGPGGKGLFELVGRKGKQCYVNLFLYYRFSLHPTDEAQARRELAAALARGQEFWQELETQALEQEEATRPEPQEGASHSVAPCDDDATSTPSRRLAGGDDYDVFF
jgi:hypothetical protein